MPLFDYKLIIKHIGEPMIKFTKNIVKRSYSWLQKSKAGRFLVGLVLNYNKHNLGSLSAESTYYLILSIVPFIIFLINLILFFAHSQLPLVLKGLEVLPLQTQVQIKPVILQMLSRRSETILSIGILAAFWSTAKGVQGLVRAINVILGTEGKDDNIIVVYVKAVVFTFMWALNGIASLFILVYGDALVKFIARHFVLPNEILIIWKSFMYSVPAFMVLLGLTILYRYAPKVSGIKRLSWKKSLFSSVCATIIWFIVTNMYRYYVANMGNLSMTYGPLVGLMALFIWINLSVRAVLIGVEITRVLEDIEVLNKRDIQ